MFSQRFKRNFHAFKLSGRDPKDYDEFAAHIMAFEILFNDPHTGEPKVAHVSFFVWEANQLEAVYNVKGEASQRALDTGRRELENFVSYIEAMQQSPEFGASSIKLDGRETKLRDISISGMRRVVCGPRGSRKMGFDEELRFSREQLEQIARQIAEATPESA